MANGKAAQRFLGFHLIGSPGKHTGNSYANAKRQNSQKFDLRSLLHRITPRLFQWPDLLHGILRPISLITASYEQRFNVIKSNIQIDRVEYVHCASCLTTFGAVGFS